MEKPKMRSPNLTDANIARLREVLLTANAPIAKTLRPVRESIHVFARNKSDLEGVWKSSASDVKEILGKKLATALQAGVSTGVGFTMKRLLDEKKVLSGDDESRLIELKAYATKKRETIGDSSAAPFLRAMFQTGTGLR
jgi:hypothetical protein